MFAAAAVGICLVGHCMAASRMPPALVSDPESPCNTVASPSAGSSNQSASRMEEGCVPVNCSGEDDRYCCYTPVTSLVSEASDRPERYPLGKREERMASDESSDLPRSSGLHETASSTSSPRQKGELDVLLRAPLDGEQVQRIERRLEAAQRRQRSLKRRVTSFGRRLATKRRAHVEDDVRRELDAMLLDSRKSETREQLPPLAVSNKEATGEPMDRQELHPCERENIHVGLGRRLERVLSDRNSQRVCAGEEASRDEMEASFHNWALQISRLERQADDEATESEASATDDESDDESESWSESKVKTTFRDRLQEIRTEWRHDCASLSSRWHWLQQRIADLEQTIRRQTEVCETLKSTKQQFKFAEKEASPTPEEQRHNCPLLFFVPSSDISDCRPTNGLLLKLNQASKMMNEDCYAARTRPLIHRPCRRVVRMCREGASERLAVVGKGEIGDFDVAFHHKLSVNTDIPIPLLLEASLRHDRWKLAERKRKSSMSLSNDKKKQFLSRSANSSMLSEKGMRDRSLSAPSTPRPRSNSMFQDTRLCRTELKKRHSTDDSPLSASMPGSALASLLKQQRRRPMSSAFDINNIIIPNSFASTTRVERLQYKNIVTPKWREVNRGDAKKIQQMKGTNGVSCSPPQLEIEDLSDEAFSQRHGRAEQAERKRFMAWNKLGTSLVRHSATSSTSTSPTTPITPAIPDEEELPTSHVRRVFRRMSSTYDRWQDMLREAEVSTVPPFSLRTFPLSEDTYDKMVVENQIPVEHSYIPASLISTRAKIYNTGMSGIVSESHRGMSMKTPTDRMSPGQWDSEESYLPSPLSVADLSDTETEQNQWAVVSLSEKPQEAVTGTEDSSTNRSIVIKLTKR